MANLGKSVKGKNKKKKEEKSEKIIAGKAKRVFEVDLNKRLAALTRKMLRVRLCLCQPPLDAHLFGLFSGGSGPRKGNVKVEHGQDTERVAKNSATRQGSVARNGVARLLVLSPTALTAGGISPKGC